MTLTSCLVYFFSLLNCLLFFYLACLVSTLSVVPFPLCCHLHHVSLKAQSFPFLGTFLLWFSIFEVTLGGTHFFERFYSSQNKSAIDSTGLSKLLFLCSALLFFHEFGIAWYRIIFLMSSSGRDATSWTGQSDGKYGKKNSSRCKDINFHARGLPSMHLHKFSLIVICIGRVDMNSHNYHY